jgi:uncharacterized protein (DUF1330 family)
MYFGVGLAMIAGTVLGAAAVTGLHAQAKPPVYTVSEINVTNKESFVKDYLPLARASIKKSGGKVLAGSYTVTSLDGAAPATRVAIQMWDSMEQVQAYRNSVEFKEARKIGDKYATYHSFAVEGVAK